MSYRFATYEKRGRIAYVTVNRPEVMNALHLEAHLELAEIWEDFRDDPEVWVAILTGAGDRAFSAGNDLKATAERTANGGDIQGDTRPPFGRITRDFHCPKPMIAAVNGVAVGGGLEMALACDIIVAADHARFGLPEPRVGLFAGAGGIHRLARQLPFKIAMGLLLTGRLFGAEEAHRIGLVNEVVPLADLMTAAERWAAEILNCSPLSVQLTKESAFDGLQYSVDDALGRDRERVERLLASADFVEGPKAFSEKRSPQWTGRCESYPCWMSASAAFLATLAASGLPPMHELSPQEARAAGAAMVELYGSRARDAARGGRRLRAASRSHRARPRRDRLLPRRRLGPRRARPVRRAGAPARRRGPAARSSSSTTASLPSIGIPRRSRTLGRRWSGRRPTSRRSRESAVPLIVAGDSAGGCLAALVAQRSREVRARDRAPGARVSRDRLRSRPRLLPRPRQPADRRP